MRAPSSLASVPCCCSPAAVIRPGATFTADGLRVRVSPDSDEPGGEKLRRQANVVLELTQGFKVGYRGWYTCSNEKTGSGAGS